MATRFSNFETRFESRRKNLIAPSLFLRQASTLAEATLKKFSVELNSSSEIFFEISTSASLRVKGDSYVRPRHERATQNRICSN